MKHRYSKVKRPRLKSYQSWCDSNRAHFKCHWFDGKAYYYGYAFYGGLYDHLMFKNGKWYWLAEILSPKTYLLFCQHASSSVDADCARQRLLARNVQEQVWSGKYNKATVRAVVAKYRRLAKCHSKHIHINIGQLPTKHKA